MADEKDILKEQIRKAGYDVGVTDPNAQGGVTPPNGNVTPGIDDLSKRTKTTLGRYLSAATQKNYKGISPTVRDAQPFTTDAGVPAPLEKVSNDGIEHSVEFAQTRSTTDAFDAADGGAPFSQALKKGKKAVGEFDGNTLLKDNAQTVRTRYTSAVLKNNRFKVDNQYRADLRNPGDSDASLTYYSRKKAGDTEHYETSINSAKSISVQQMQNVSKVLMLRATGEIDSNSRDYNPDGNVGALLPGAAQILPVQIINSRDIEARDVLEAMIGEEIGSHSPGPDSKSWGALNNHLESFTGILPAGMIALCIALILATQLAFEILKLIMSLVPDKPRIAFDPVTGIRQKGKFRFAGNEGKGLFGSGISLGGIEDLQGLLGLRDTEYPYNDCVDAGMSQFFGTPPDGGLGAKLVSAVTNSFKKALESPGFYIIFCRSIIRSGYGIGKKLSEIGSNPLQIAQGIANIIEDLRSSKIIAAFNMFAGLGDALKRESFSKKNNLSQDDIPNEASPIYKSRLKGTTALAWRQASAASLYILPSSFSNQAVNALGKEVVGVWDMKFSDASEKFKRGTNIYGAEANVNRIPTDIVKKLELLLDAEHVPFYFHDMRTNEIIQFHAFLTSLTEDYTPNWENVEAYGRVDPVRIYKNTVRRVNLSFRIISLDADDFDNMWFKINKLVTLVYPQWSRGKRVTSEDLNIEFSQPFSQLISSSPLIRLRIGDLIKSNYSRFNLTRIFDVSEGSGATAKRADVLSKLQEIADAINRWSLITNATVAPPDEKDRNKVKEALESKTIEAFLNPCQMVVDPADAASLGSALASAVSSLTGKKDNKKKSRNFQSNKRLKIGKILDSGDKGVVFELDDKEFESTQKTKKVGVAYGNHIVFSWAKGVDKLVPKPSNPSLGPNSEKLLDPETNPIVKYFENNMGRGLAGTIDSMNFAWLEENTWNVHDLGSQAPKSCTVTISFTPIHDIAPGIDYAGFNRAPVYKVGKQVAMVTGKSEYDNVKPLPTAPKDEDGQSNAIELPKLPF